MGCAALQPSCKLKPIQIVLHPKGKKDVSISALIIENECVGWVERSATHHFYDKHLLLTDEK